MKKNKILLLLFLWLFTGCTISNSILFGRTLNDFCQHKSCCQQAMLYAEYIEGKAMSNGTHCFVVKNEKLYDSTCMKYTGFSIHSWRVQKVYGKPINWKELKR